MSRSTIFAHILRRDDGPSTGMWGPYTLHSAFQPIFGFHGGRLVVDAFEGLIRPFRGQEAVAPPAFFSSIPAGERLQVETLTRSLHLLNAGKYLNPATALFINFDPSVFNEREIASTTLREMRLTLHEANVGPGRIVCEVTEQKATSPQALSNFVAALRDHGFRIAVDDYGAEESDMARVSALEPDIVKFDANLISRLMGTQPGTALLAVMVEEFASNGIRTVFEGIEEGWQLELAEKSGAHMVQGYALARPELAPFSFAVAMQGDAVARDAPAKSAEAVRKTESSALPVKRFGKRYLS